MTWGTLAELVRLVEGRGYRCVECSRMMPHPSGRIVDYEVQGPRGSSRLISPNDQGLYPLHNAESWCDEFDGNTAYVEQHKAARKS